MMFALSACAAGETAVLKEEAVEQTGNPDGDSYYRKAYIYYDSTIYVFTGEGLKRTEADKLTYIGMLEKVEQDMELLDEDFEGFNSPTGELYKVEGKHTLYLKSDFTLRRYRPLNPDDPMKIEYKLYD